MKNHAGLWMRVKAFMFDYFIILGYVIAITLVFVILRLTSAHIDALFADRLRAQAVVFLILTLPVSLYFALHESSARQATWGKQRAGLRVTDRDGNRIRFWRSLARTMLKFVPWELSHTLIWETTFSQGATSTLVKYGFALVYLLIGANIASLALTRTKQSIYDLLAGTYVLT
jgi:uncharacterized RDD family membrane protein YckC